MTFSIDSLSTTHHLIHGQGFPVNVMGVGPTTRRGSSYIEGPSVFGMPFIWPYSTATVMIGPDTNIDIKAPIMPGAVIACGEWNHSPYSLHVVGDVAINDHLEVNLDINVGSTIRAGALVQSQGDVWAFCGLHRLSNKKDLPFDIPHPNKKGWRLRHVCIEGPEIAVYCRGKVPSDGIIELPSFWDGLVNYDDMSINITPIGNWQELFVKKIENRKVFVCNNIDGKINADYHIIARRLDDDLIVEYEGEDYTDYPGGNEGYSFNFEKEYVEDLIKNAVKETVVNMKDT